VLEGLIRAAIKQDVHRFANLEHIAQFAAKKGLTIEQVADVIAFDTDDITKQLMDGPFERKPSLGNKFGLLSRFSNGDWPVFYAAIGRETAEKESSYHYGRKAAGDPASRPVCYSILRIQFSGSSIDLIPQLSEWPDLVSNDYTFCNGLGQEAHDSALDGFFSPSAQNEGGTTLPAFKRESLSLPIVEAAARLSFSGAVTTVEIKELSSV
jgi:RES domain